MNNLKSNGKFVFLIFVFLMLSQAQHAVAYKNGSYAYNKAEYDYEKDYGTHDWVAEAALDALFDEDSSEWTWLYERKEIFLLGTEAPDNANLETSLDGKTVEGFGDTTKHHVYLDYNTGEVSNNEDDAALRAKKCGDLADANLEEDKFETAAFYLGAMVHYIADLGVFCHVSENNVAPHNKDFDEYHSKYESYIYSRSNDYEDREEFFEIDGVKIEDDKKPYNLALDLAWDTYKDEKDSEDVVYMNDNFFTDWASDKDDRKSESQTRQDYYDRVEESLNNAIEAAASAINYIGGKPSIPAYPSPFLLCIVGVSIIGIVLKIKKS